MIFEWCDYADPFRFPVISTKEARRLYMAFRYRFAHNPSLLCEGN